jgi:hypothetical protein
MYPFTRKHHPKPNILVLLLVATLATSTATLSEWQALYQRTPYPYGTPLPPAMSGPFDSVYVKLDPKPEPIVHCRRCPDSAPEGGLWKIGFDRGIFRIYFPGTNWKSMAACTVDGDRLTLFNDPNCIDVVGTYTWKLENRQLTLVEIDGSCAIRLRAMNLTHQPWDSCQLPNKEAAVTDRSLAETGRM